MWEGEYSRRGPVTLHGPPGAELTEGTGQNTIATGHPGWLAFTGGQVDRSTLVPRGLFLTITAENVQQMRINLRLW